MEETISELLLFEVFFFLFSFSITDLTPHFSTSLANLPFETSASLGLSSLPAGRRRVMSRRFDEEEEKTAERNSKKERLDDYL